MNIEGQPLTEQKISFIGALNRLQKRLNPTKEELAAMRKVLKQQYPDGMTDSELQRFTERWEQKGNEHAQSAAR